MKSLSYTIDDLFPEGGRVLLTGSGKEFIERIGVEAAKQAVLAVLRGENLRTQTEPLTRRRLTQLSGALVFFFTKGWSTSDTFTDDLSTLAASQLLAGKKGKNNKGSTWLAQWLVGLTNKQVQNVLRSDQTRLIEYLKDFETAVDEAAQKCELDFGKLNASLGFIENSDGKRLDLTWTDLARLTTAIGSMTLAVRGSDKSLYGKIFERLILGSVLSILGFTWINPNDTTKAEMVFWLSDRRDNRESDATAIIRKGKVARFDIGFIGPGNSEISKDKLSRFAREIEIGKLSFASSTFIIIDRLPSTSRTLKAAKTIKAEIIQMSMQFWPRDLAKRLSRVFRAQGYNHPIADMNDTELDAYMTAKITEINIQDFVGNLETAEVVVKVNDSEIEG